MICKHCGEEIDTRVQRTDGSVVCPCCGAIYRRKDSSHVNKQPAPNSSEKTASTRTKSNSGGTTANKPARVTIFLVIANILLAAGIGAYLFMTLRKDQVVSATTEKPVNSIDTGWNEAYKSFVENREYAAITLGNGQLFYTEEYNQSDSSKPKFGLYDMDRDGIPELIGYNGCPDAEGAFDAVFTWKDSNMQYVGNVGTRRCELYSFENTDYPGLFCTDGIGGIYSTYYYTIEDNDIKYEHVLDYDYNDLTGGSPTVTKVTQDDALYTLELNNKKSDLVQLTGTEIHEMGWEPFVYHGYINLLDEKTISYNGYTTSFGPRELSIDSTLEDANKNMMLLCGMLCDAAYSDHGVKVSEIYRQMFDGSNYDEQFDYDEASFCSSFALGEMRIDGQMTNILCVDIRGTNMTPAELLYDFSDSITEVGSLRVYTAVADFFLKIRDRLNRFIEKQEGFYDKPVKVIITGHSLGGAAANILGAYMTASTEDNEVWPILAEKRDVFVYTFGTINSVVTKESISNGFENIHNIIHQQDPAVRVSDFARGNDSSNGIFGHIDWCNSPKKNIDPLEHHMMYTYLDVINQIDSRISEDNAPFTNEQRYIINRFLSYFSEQGAFEKGYGFSIFDETTPWVDTRAELIRLAFYYSRINHPENVFVEGNFHTISLDVVNDVLRTLLDGTFIINEDEANDFTQHNDYYAHYSYGNFFFPGSDDGSLNDCNKLSIVTTVEKHGDDRYLLNFDIYELSDQIYMNAENNRHIPEKYYYFSAFDAQNSPELTKLKSGTAFVVTYENDGQTTYRLNGYWWNSNSSVEIETPRDEDNEAEIKAPEQTESVYSGDFSILGKWKSVGEEGFGQAQPGAIIVFDGDHCNFFSPYDTYSFYKISDGKYRLEATSFLFQDTTVFDVRVIDDNNIEVDYDSLVTKLTRTS